MFIGEYTYNIDEKKRLAIPVKFRKALEKKIVVTRGLDRCLAVYSAKDWSVMAKKLSQIPYAQADARGLARLILAGAMEVVFDSLGRILVPDYLKDYASLKKNVVIVGVFNRIEIWDKNAWDEYREKMEKESGNIAERLKELGI